MTDMTQDKFEELTQVAINDAIYDACKKIGHFMQAVWLFKVPQSPDDDGPIIGTAIQVPEPDKAKYAIAYARRSVQNDRPDFSILAGGSMIVKSREEAEARIAEINASPGGIPINEERQAYAFYCQAPGLEPVVWMQRFHRDKEGLVVLDGGLRKPKSDKVMFGEELKEQDPWLPPTAEDYALIGEGKMSVLDARLLQPDGLGISSLFPKERLN